MNRVEGLHLYTDSFVKDKCKNTYLFLHNIQLQDKHHILNIKKKNSQKVFARIERQYQTLQEKLKVWFLVSRNKKFDTGKPIPGLNVLLRHEKRGMFELQCTSYEALFNYLPRVQSHTMFMALFLWNVKLFYGIARSVQQLATG
jgi:hypothetical protein